MMNEAVKARFEADLNGKTLSRVQRALCNPVKKVLLDFCEQDPEFVRSILESRDKSFVLCLAQIYNANSGSISDLDAYTKAAQYYFPGCRIEQKLVLHCNPYEAELSETPILNIFDIL